MDKATVEQAALVTTGICLAVVTRLRARGLIDDGDIAAIAAAAGGATDTPETQAAHQTWVDALLRVSIQGAP